MTVFAILIIVAGIAGVIALAWKDQLAQWAQQKVLNRLRRGADNPEIDEDYAATLAPPSTIDQDARDKGVI